jgi:hypothetical protein
LRSSAINLKSIRLPLLFRALPIDFLTPLSLEECAARLAQRQNKIRVHLAPVRDNSAHFHMTKQVNYFYEIEASGKLEQYSVNATIVTAQVRVSAFTYGMTLLFAVLAVLFMQSIFSALFVLLFLRMMMMIVVCTNVCKEEMVALIIDTLDTPALN